MEFKYGIYYKDFLYGWYNNKLYRLPKIGRKVMPLKKLKKIKVGNSFGYNLARDKKSIAQLQVMTTEINYTLKIVKSKHCPF